MGRISDCTRLRKGEKGDEKGLQEVESIGVGA